MSFGVYVHVPFCLQHCPYCDFAVFELKQPEAISKYIALLMREIQQRSVSVGPQSVTSLYFGGGTPSLAEPRQLAQVRDELDKHGFKLARGAEVTLEINPGTIDRTSLQRWLDAGINRFSVGAQTFDDAHLKKIGRKHFARDTIETLSLLHGSGVNFTLDILFALPGQTKDEVLRDVETALSFNPPHVSVYCLTLPEKHSLNRGRAPDHEQAEMFELIEQRLNKAGITRYEVSNYGRPGHESRHNQIYWSDAEYWGIGLSAHSYLKREAWGVRFWNPPGLKAYENLIRAAPGPQAQPYETLPPENIERLTLEQSLTDFCHTHLRTLVRGLPLAALEQKYPSVAVGETLRRLRELEQKGLVERREESWRLTRQGRLIADQVFEALTFLENEIFPEKTGGLGGAPG